MKNSPTTWTLTAPTGTSSTTDPTWDIYTEGVRDTHPPPSEEG